jgi:hypothetical protein
MESFAGTVLKPLHRWMWVLLAYSTFVHPSVAGTPPCVDYANTIHWLNEVALPEGIANLAVNGGFGYVTCGFGGLRIVDVSDPSHFLVLGNLSFGQSVQDLDVSGSIVYLAVWAGLGLKVVDVSQPSAPTVIGTLSGSLTTCIDYSDNYCYFSNNSSVQGSPGAVIADVSNPTNPITVGTLPHLDHECRDIQYANHHLFLGLDLAWLVIYNVEDPSSPQFVGSKRVSAASTSARDIFISGSYAYVACGFAGVAIVDISNLADPQVIATADTPGFAHQLSISGSTMYIADGVTGLAVVDIQSPQNPVLLGHLDFISPTFDVVANGPLAHLASGVSVQLADIDGEAEIDPIGQVETPGLAGQVELSGDLAYVCDDTSGVQVIDISDPSTPTVIGSANTPGHAADVAVGEPYIYVADQNKGLAVLEVSQPDMPILLNSIHTPGWATSLEIAGNYAYVTHAYLGIYDLSNPEQPIVVSILDQGQVNAYDVDYRDGKAYLACDTAGFRIADVSQPLNPFLTGALDTPGNARNVVVHSNIAYVADGTRGIQIIDISNSTNPYLEAAIDTPGYARGMSVSWPYLYVADSECGVQVFDVRNPSAPIRLGTANTPGECRDLTLFGDCVLTCNWGSGLTILPRHCETVTSAGLDFPTHNTQIFVAPNPLGRGGTQITFGTLSAGRADLGVYDVSGRRVATLFQGNSQDLQRGFFWDGRSQGGRLTPGVYFLKLALGETVRTEKVTVVR